MSVSGPGGAKMPEDINGREGQAAEEVKEAQYGHRTIKKESKKADRAKLAKLFRKQTEQLAKSSRQLKRSAFKAIDRKFFRQQTKQAMRELREINKREAKLSQEKNREKDEVIREYLLDQLRDPDLADKAGLERPPNIDTAMLELAEKLREIRNLRSNLLNLVVSKKIEGMNFVMDKPAMLDPDSVNKLLELEKEFRNLITGWGHKPEEILKGDLEKALAPFSSKKHDLEA